MVVLSDFGNYMLLGNAPGQYCAVDIHLAEAYLTDDQLLDIK